MSVTIPNALTEEKAILGCLMQDPGIIDAVSLLLAPDAFFDARCRQAFELLQEMHRLGVPIDAVTVAKGARERKIDTFVNALFLCECNEATPSAANFPVYAQTINAAATRRKIADAGALLIKEVQDESIDVETIVASTAGRIERISQDASERKQPRVIHGAQSVTAAIDGLEWRFNNRGVLSGLKTPFQRLNELTDGLQMGELSVIAARPSQGKTAIALNIIEGACFDSKIPTLFFSLEMSHTAICNRLICSRQRIDSGLYRRAELEQGDFDKITRLAVQMKGTPFYITPSGNWTIDQVASASARFIRQNNVRLIVVDYLQKIKPVERHEKRTYEVAEAVQGLKEIAKRHNVHVLALAQLNRESEKEKGRAPRLSDIGDSGQIEREADLVGLLYRHADGDTQSLRKVDLIIAKQRDGETGIVPLTFRANFLRFEQRSMFEESEEQAA